MHRPRARQPAGRGDKASLCAARPLRGRSSRRCQRFPLAAVELLLDGVGGRSGSLAGIPARPRRRPRPSAGEHRPPGLLGGERCPLPAAARLQAAGCEPAGGRERPAGIPAQQPEPAAPPGASSARRTRPHAGGWLITLLPTHSRHVSCGTILGSRQTTPYFGFLTATHRQYKT